MKLIAFITEDLKVSGKSIIVEFESDEQKQHFEVICLFSPFFLEINKMIMDVEYQDGK